MSGICLFIYDFDNTIDKTNSPTKAKIVKLSIFDHTPGVYVHVKCQMWINFFFPPWPSLSPKSEDKIGEYVFIPTIAVSKLVCQIQFYQSRWNHTFFRDKAYVLSGRTYQKSYHMVHFHTKPQIKIVV